MSWRTVAAVLSVIFALVVLWAVAADPLLTVGEAFQDTGDNSNQYYDGDALIDEYITSWFNMVLVAVFGLMAWGVWYVLRREITRGGGGL